GRTSGDLDAPQRVREPIAGHHGPYRAGGQQDAVGVSADPVGRDPYAAEALDRDPVTVIAAQNLIAGDRGGRRGRTGVELDAARVANQPVGVDHRTRRGAVDPDADPVAGDHV